MSDLTAKPLVVILGHGSRRPEGQFAIVDTAARYRTRHPECHVRHAFIEFAEPTLSACVDDVITAHDVRDIYVMPLFLALGNHCAKHIPEQIKELQARYPERRFLLARPLGADPLLCDIVENRINELLDD